PISSRYTDDGWRECQWQTVRMDKPLARLPNCPRNCRMSGALTANRERRQAKRERARRRSAQSQHRVYALTITTIRIRGQNHDHPWLVTPPERPRWPKRPRQLAPFRPLA